MNKKILALLTVFCMCFSLVACISLPVEETYMNDTETSNSEFHISEYFESGSSEIVIIVNSEEISIPSYSGSSYVEVNGNTPFFNKGDFTTEAFEEYSELDELGRCGVAYANVCTEIMPTDGEERGEIGQVKPSGWVTATYPEVISDRYLYNRCHLIGWQLCGENANTKNLITGTRYLNIEGMLPFENMIDDYVDDTGNHVLYRVTPYYTDNNLVADGVLMEAHSVEDDDLVFCVWAYNVQPYIHIDYATGESYQIDTMIAGVDDVEVPTTGEYTESIEDMVFDFVLNTSSMKAHDETCTYAQSISEDNRQDFTGTFEELEELGYELCKSCFGDK